MAGCDQRPGKLAVLDARLPVAVDVALDVGGHASRSKDKNPSHRLATPNKPLEALE